MNHLKNTLCCLNSMLKAWWVRQSGRYHFSCLEKTGSQSWCLWQEFTSVALQVQGSSDTWGLGWCPSLHCTPHTTSASLLGFCPPPFHSCLMTINRILSKSESDRITLLISTLLPIAKMLRNQVFGTDWRCILSSPSTHSISPPGFCQSLNMPSPYSWAFALALPLLEGSFSRSLLRSTLESLPWPFHPKKRSPTSL